MATQCDFSAADAGLIDLSPSMIARSLCERVGMRQSRRLALAVEIVYIFGIASGFGRNDVVQATQSQFHLKTVDRALSDLEAAGVLTVQVINQHRSHGGCLYRVNPLDLWGARTDARRATRRRRSGRGGVRKQSVRP